MKVTLGKEGLGKTWQAKFPETTSCCRCGGKARIGFVAHEGMEEEGVYPRDFTQFVYDLHANKGKGGYWPHDCASFAIYICRECMNGTVIWNQG